VLWIIRPHLLFQRRLICATSNKIHTSEEHGIITKFVGTTRISVSAVFHVFVDLFKLGPVLIQCTAHSANDCYR
jgi:hypothetical protein